MLPTSTNVTIEVKTALPNDAEAVVCFVAQGGKISGDISMVLGSAEFEEMQRMIKFGIVRGKPREVDFDLLESPPGKFRRVYLAGLGDANKMTGDTIRQAAGALVRVIRKHRLKRVAVVPPVIHHGREALGTQLATEGMLLAAFKYDEYRGTGQKEDDDEKGDAKKSKQPARVTLISSKSAVKAIQAAVNRAQFLCDAQNFARTIAFRPGNDVNPPRLAQIAQQAAKEVGLTCRVLDEKQMKRLGMGGILAVGGGSPNTPPRMIVLEWKGSGRKTRIEDGESRMAKGVKRRSGSPSSILHSPSSPLLLVGKAITFDTGGISIKPALNMQDMVFDKCGAMAVLGAMVAIARLKLPVPVVGIMAAAENHISSTAYRPGDILRMYNGVTVEVTNTDAEGRLVLGDALAWGIETYKPAAVVDLATLTGAMVIALGFTHCGVFGNNDKLVAELDGAAQRAGERIWRLPLTEDHKDLLKSEVADLKNSQPRDAGSIKGALFLSYFVPRGGSLPWCHMDIAGVADTDKELPYYGKGATGWGVRTLVHWCEARAGVLPHGHEG